MPIYDAAMRYKEEGVPLLVIAGKEFGTGSSRDWAAKGENLLGVKAVIAESHERIHRSNLIGMGVLPLQFLPTENRQTLNLTGKELYHIIGLEQDLIPGRSRCVIRLRLALTAAPVKRRSRRRVDRDSHWRWSSTATAASCRTSCAKCCEFQMPLGC